MDLIIWIYIIMFFFGVYFLLLFLLLYARHKNELYEYPIAKNLPFVSLITSAYNEQASIADTINATMSLDYPKDKFEHIIINDGSKDKTAEIVKNLQKKYPNLRLINKENSGKARSLNEALKIAKGELIAVIDADSYPKPDSLKKMVGYFEDNKVAAVTSRVLVKNKKNFIERFQAFDYVVIAWSRKILDFINCVYVTNGPLSLYKKSLVKKAGGFDPSNLTEDIEITWHLLSQGYKTKMCYGAKVYTTVPSKLGQWVKQRTRWNIGGLQTMIKYRNFFFRGENLFGYFVISYVSLSFFLALIGIILLLRWAYLGISIYLFSVPYLFEGYNPFKFIDISFSLTFLFIFGMMFLAMSVLYYKISAAGSDLKSKSILTILIYSFVYRSLYGIPYLIALYKLVKGDVGWYTK